MFWAVGYCLDEACGWRATLAAFAAIKLALCLPLHRIGLARREETPGAGGGAREPVSSDALPLEGSPRVAAIALFALVMALNRFVFGVVSVQLVPLLEAAGLATAAAVWIAAAKGFAQFGGRVVEPVFGRRLHPRTVARIAIGALPLSFALLALFGARGYGAVPGVLATPPLVVRAAAPSLFATIVERGSWGAGLAALGAASVGSWLAIETVARWSPRQRPPRGA